MFLLEYATNKLFVSGYPTHMYLVLDWETVILITDPNSKNTFKTFAFPVPNFDEETNPFIAVCGKASLNLLNIKTRKHMPLINQKMVVGYPGLQGSFMKFEKYGISVHYASVVQDTDGSGSDLLQYSYAELKGDVLHWLRENGRLPTATMEDHFEEVKKMNQLEEEVKKMNQLEEETKALKTENTQLREENDKRLADLQESEAKKTQKL